MMEELCLCTGNKKKNYASFRNKGEIMENSNTSIRRRFEAWSWMYRLLFTLCSRVSNCFWDSDGVSMCKSFPWVPHISSCSKKTDVFFLMFYYWYLLLLYITMLPLDRDTIFSNRELKIIISCKKKTFYRVQSEVAYYSFSCHTYLPY